MFLLDAKTCEKCDGDGVLYEEPGEPYCDQCNGCGDVALDGSRLEVLSHGDSRPPARRRFRSDPPD